MYTIQVPLYSLTESVVQYKVRKDKTGVIAQDRHYIHQIIHSQEVWSELQ